MARIPIALQLYSVRHECEKDLPKTLAAVAEMGYEGVEFAGYYGRSAKELRKLLDDVGLKTVGSHNALDVFMGDSFADTVAFNRELGNRVLIAGGGISRDQRGSRQAWLDAADTHNKLSEKLALEEMLVGYHNHDFEFSSIIDGETAWDIFMGNTRKEVVMQLDLGHVLRGGGDCLSVLERYPGRAITVHLKPYTKMAGRPAQEGYRPLIGDDDLPWADIFRLCETIGGTEWYIVEYESDAYPAMEAVKRCLDTLRAMGK